MSRFVLVFTLVMQEREIKEGSHSINSFSTPGRYTHGCWRRCTQNCESLYTHGCCLKCAQELVSSPQNRGLYLCPYHDRSLYPYDWVYACRPCRSKPGRKLRQPDRCRTPRRRIDHLMSADGLCKHDAHHHVGCYRSYGRDHGVTNPLDGSGATRWRNPPNWLATRGGS